jgi:hypothetical protein
MADSDGFKHLVAGSFAYRGVIEYGVRFRNERVYFDKSFRWSHEMFGQYFCLGISGTLGMDGVDEVSP